MTEIVQNPGYVPIINQRVPYISDMNISTTSTTVLSVTDGKCSNWDNTLDIVIETDAGATSIDSAENGLNGLDTGVLQANKFYYIYAVSDITGFNPPGFLLSLSATQPYIPTGYGTWRMIGGLPTGGTATFFLAYQVGNSNDRTFRFYYSPITILSGGNDASVTEISLLNYVPPVSYGLINVMGKMTPTVAGQTLILIPGNGNNINNPTAVGQVSSIVTSVTCDLVYALNGNNVPVVSYFVSNSAASATIYMLGYTMYF